MRVRFQSCQHKYGAKAVFHDGYRFPSILEGDVYCALKLLQKAGEVLFFLRQVTFHLPGGVKYDLDYLVFYSDGTVRLIEAKGFETKEFKNKKKLVEAIYPVKIEIVKRIEDIYSINMNVVKRD